MWRVRYAGSPYILKGNMNFTIIVGIILVILGIWAGFKTGFVKGITHLVALIATIVTLALILMLTSSYRAGETKNTIFTLVIMAILGAVYSVVRFLLRSFKVISKLPIIEFANSIFGVLIGLLWVLVLFMALVSLGMRGYLGPVSPIIQNDVNSNLFLTIISKYNIFL